MPREARVTSSIGVYHTILRGVNKQQIFECTEDYEHFVRILQRQCSLPIDTRPSSYNGRRNVEVLQKLSNAPVLEEEPVLHNLNTIMARFIELHENNRPATPILINVDSIAFITPDNNGCFLHFACTRLSSSNNGSSLYSVSSNMEVRHVKESYNQVKAKLDE